MSNKPFAVIFDMDGVIFDSERAYIDSFREVTREAGIPFDQQACLDCIGVNWNRCKEIFEEAYGEWFDFPYYYNRVRERMGVLKFDIKPGVYEIFSYLNERQVPIALASSTTEQSVRKMLSQAQLISAFDQIICGDMVKHSKPHPEIFMTAADRLGYSVDDCYVIEDSYNGIRAAKNAGMHPIMVPDMLPQNETMRELADVILPDLLAVIDYLKEV